MFPVWQTEAMSTSCLGETKGRRNEMIWSWLMTNTKLELPCPKNWRNANADQNFAAKLQEVTNISMEIKVREYEQMMLGGYI